MKLILTTFLIISFTTISSQTRVDQVNLLFYLNNDETYNKQNRLLKKEEEKNILFSIEGEKFNFQKKKKIDTCNNFDKTKLVDILYLKNKAKSTKEFKHHIFKEIYIFEKINCNQYLKYNVIWIDDRFGIN